MKEYLIEEAKCKYNALYELEDENIYHEDYISWIRRMIKIEMHEDLLYSVSMVNELETPVPEGYYDFLKEPADIQEVDLGTFATFYFIHEYHNYLSNEIKDEVTTLYTKNDFKKAFELQFEQFEQKTDGLLREVLIVRLLNQLLELSKFEEFEHFYSKYKELIKSDYLLLSIEKIKNS